jgi:hypothetical protein
MKNQNQPTNLGFQPDFLECLIDEAFYLIIGGLPEPQRQLADDAFWLLSILLWQARGATISDDDLKELPKVVGEMTRLIWELGGKFANSLLVYQKQSA